ncbi:MAG TPA: right-handed parallel beta-helix repeat-containing protein [Candidatus Eisenbacteria bacterium]|nr:right-handed parallel beta-helix repeat-containing protein [Candidatus Eisenbacteria bacterium]
MLCSVWSALLVGISAEARTIVLKADGTGDVPTFQAGVDSLLKMGDGYQRDTLRVLAGYYDEDVNVEHGLSTNPVILCPDGPQATEVRTLEGLTAPYFGYPLPLTISGLQVRGATQLGKYSHRVTLASCRFLDTLTILRIGYYGGDRIIDCEFLGPANIFAAGITIRRCHFVGATARFSLWADFSMSVEDCVFEGGTDTAAVTRPFDVDDVTFSRCVFRDVGTGLVVYGSGGSAIARGARVGDCRFEDIRGAAIDFTYSEPRPFRSSVTGCSFQRCGSAIAGSTEHLLNLDMSADTLTACRRAGIDATFVKASLQGLLIQGGGGPGAILRGGASVAISGCIISGNRGDALSLMLGEYADRSVAMRANTIAGNGGAGIRLSPSVETAPSHFVEIENNLVAGNDAGGIVVEAHYEGHIQYNDAWMNRGGDYVGVLAPSANLVADPQFCDVSADDFQLASHSPCAPSGPYGQIGALGVGCEVMNVPVDVQSRPINLRSNAPVEAAILGDRLFDPHRVDPSTVRLAGVAPSPRGKNSPQLRDVNQDGLADLTLSFDARDLRFEGGEVPLEGRTLDGVPFRGSDVVEVRNTPQASLEEGGIASTRFALSVTQAHGGTGLSLLLDLPSQSPATIEAFDVAGRRVLSRELSAPLSGHHRVQLQERLPSGLYLLRLRQGTAAVVARGVILR